VTVISNTIFDAKKIVVFVFFGFIKMLKHDYCVTRKL